MSRVCSCCPTWDGLQVSRSLWGTQWTQWCCLLNSTHLRTSMSISQAENADPVTPEANLCLPCKSLGPAEGLDLAHTAGSWRRKQQRAAGVTQTCSLLGISLPVSSGREKPHAPRTWNKSIAYRRAAVRDSRSLASQSPEVQGSVPEWRGFTLHTSCQDNQGVLKVVLSRCYALESPSTKLRHQRTSSF